MYQTYFLQGLFPTSEEILENFTWINQEEQERAVFVDKTVQVLKISIKGGFRLADVDFCYPNGKFSITHLFDILYLFNYTMYYKKTTTFFPEYTIQRINSL